MVATFKGGEAMSNDTELDPTALNGEVLSLLREHHAWHTPYTLRQRIEELTGRWVSDSTITARLRDLRKLRYGAHQIITERLPHSHTCRYRLVGK
jgi:DNA-binding PadR family transcriptional regulator